MTYDYVLFKPERKAFYGRNCCGYYTNPEMAGLYTEEYAKKYEQEVGGQVKAYNINSHFVRKAQKAHDERVINKIYAALECVPPERRYLLVGTALQQKAKNDATNYPSREYNRV